MASPEQFGSRAFRAPIVPSNVTVREVSATSLQDLIRLLAEGVADAQAGLDRASAELVSEFANTHVEIVPTITELVDAAGNVTFKQGKPQKVSLLDLGLSPTFYQFSEAKVEVALDLKIVESEGGPADAPAKRVGLFAETSNLRLERRLNRDLSVSSKLTATLIPVPRPLRVEPTRITQNTAGK